MKEVSYLSQTTQPVPLSVGKENIRYLSLKKLAGKSGRLRCFVPRSGSKFEFLIGMEEKGTGESGRLGSFPSVVLYL